MLDLDPESMNPDAKHWLCLFLYNFRERGQEAHFRMAQE
jgi:hypothetical protein